MAVLPNSDAIGDISNRYHENIPNDKRQFIIPTIHIELSSQDYFYNQETGPSTIINIPNNRL